MVLVVWDNWGEHVCRQLSDFLVQAALTDVTINVGQKSIKTHRIILSFFSSFFKSILSDIREEQPVVIVFPDVNFRALQIVITYMYRGQVNIPADMLPQVTELANLLKVKGLLRLPTYINSNPKSENNPEELGNVVSDQVDFGQEAEGIVELEVSSMDGEPAVSDSSPVINARTAVTVITNTSSPCMSPRKVVNSPLHVKEDQSSSSQSSVTPGIDMQKGESSNSDDHIFIASEDIQMSVVDSLTPTHIVKLSEDGSISEVLFDGDYMDEERSVEGQTCLKENQLISDKQRLSPKRRLENPCKVGKYRPDDLGRAIEDLRVGNGSLREIARRWGVPKSTLSVSAKVAGIATHQKSLNYGKKSIEQAIHLIRAGASYDKAAKECNIPKSVLWRKCRKDNLISRESQRYFTYTQDDIVRAREMLCSGHTLVDIVKATKIPKTTVFHMKEQLVREGKMPASCITRVFRPRRLSEGSIQQAVVACKESGMSISQASEKMQVAKTTVWRRLQKLKELECDGSPSRKFKTNHTNITRVKVEPPDRVDLDNCQSLEELEPLTRNDHTQKKKEMDNHELVCTTVNSGDGHTVVLGNDSFLQNDGTVIHKSIPMAIKQETSLAETDENEDEGSENSASTHFQLEMPLVNLPGGGYQVVGSEIVIGGQHMVVLESSESSQLPDSEGDRHIIVAPFTEMEVVNDEASNQPSNSRSSKSHIFTSVQEALAASSSPQGITVSLQPIKTESSSSIQEKTVSDEQMSELITEFMSVD